MNEKQQQLLFDKGITNVPSDALCSDNALAESVGMIYDDGEHRVIQEPVVQMETVDSYTTATIVYVHNFTDKKRYVYSESKSGSDPTLMWGIKENGKLITKGEFSDVDVEDINSVHVTSVGKTLVVVDKNGIHYFLWKDGEYRPLGPIPVPQPEYKMAMFNANAEPVVVSDNGWPLIVTSGAYSYIERKDVVKHTLDFSGAFELKLDGTPARPDSGDTFKNWEEKFQDNYNNVVLGCYSANKKAVSQNKCFCNPFFVRIALELYDGSYYHVGAPMLMLPAVNGNSWTRLTVYTTNYTLYTICRQLAVKQTQDYTDWSDIVKDVVLFVTDDVDVNETTMDIPIFTETGKFSVTGLYANTINDDVVEQKIDQTNAGTGIQPDPSQTDELKYHYNPFKSRETSDINNDIESKSIFYKLCSLGIKKIGEWTSTREKIEKHTLENITTQEQLQNDDYFSGCPLKCSSIFAYNGRINLAGVERGFFNGFDFKKPYKVEIDINDSIKTIEHNGIIDPPCYYFFYPDPRAKTYTVQENGQEVKHDLKEHPGLNGAYYFAGIESFITNNSNSSSSGSGGGTGQESSGDESGGNNDTDDPNDNNQDTPNGDRSLRSSSSFNGDFESLPNTLITSEVNNPFVFYAHGYNNVGTGSVIGISSVTQALSEGQFGQYPLIVFASDGVWAMNVNSEGLYSSVQPISREVCNNPKSITQTDGAVYFSSEKGLMVVIGSQVRCVSEQLSGKNNSFVIKEQEQEKEQTIDLGNFQDYLKECFIAYDNRDSMLWIYNTRYQYCWVYSIKSGTFGKYKHSCDYVVNDYPDYLTSNSTTFMSFVDRPNINVDTKTGGYSGLMITRAMKLENALALKSIMQVKHIHDLADDESIKLRIFASNNLKNWVELTSLRGIPWKYYRFKYDFSNMKATDRFAGTMLVTQERRTDKLR